MPKVKADILLHLNKDKKLKGIIDIHGALDHKKDTDLYGSLLGSIVSQQLSVKAADTIWKRFVALFPDEDPKPGLVLKMKPDQLRAVGLSYQKAGYIQNIAKFALEEGLDYKKLKKLSDDDLIEHLVQIKGVGKWTVQMILMFSLGREDVFPEDDLGIQTAIKKLYNVNSEKKQLKADMHKIAAKWSPYRTIACKYLWRYKDNAPLSKK
ncbi:MAG TPA: DNA-3-methyladenine glycosylase [Bacteroidia bacterium]